MTSDQLVAERGEVDRWQAALDDTTAPVVDLAGRTSDARATRTSATDTHPSKHGALSES